MDFTHSSAFTDFLPGIPHLGLVGGQSPKATHRMTLILAPEGEDWAISLLQVTPIAEGPLSSGSPR